MTPEQARADSAAAEVIQTAAVHAEAVEKSRTAMIDAALSSEGINGAIFAQIEASIADGIKTHVNGKIETLRQENNVGMKKISDEITAHNTKHEADMIRILPALEAYEKGEQFTQSAKTSGRIILWTSGFITAVGAAYLMLIKVFHS